MIEKFDLYDFIAVLVPGLVLAWLLGPVLGVIEARLLSAQGESGSSLFTVLAVCYVAGLLLQGLSQWLVEPVFRRIWKGMPSDRWLMPDDTHWTPERRNEVTQAVYARFGLSLDAERDTWKTAPRPEALKRAHEVFYLCYRSVQATNTLPRQFNAHYGLFRCLVLTFAFATAAALYRSICVVSTTGVFPGTTVLVGCFAAFGAFIAGKRARKRAEDFAASIYDLTLLSFFESTRPSART